MRIFGNAVEAVKEVERDLYEMGLRVKTQSYQDKDISLDEDYETKELLGYSFTLTDGNDWQDTFMALGMKDADRCIAYVLNESMDRLSHPVGSLNPGKSWLSRKEVWEPFLHDGKFSYTYPERIHSTPAIHQINHLERVHNLDPKSRQLVIQIYNQVLDDHNRGGKARVPCTMHYQFLHRGEFLYLIANMRSCDLYTHFAIDLSIAWFMAHYFAGQWGAQCPRLMMQFGSLHGFRKDMQPRGIF
jgi:hypothetical protein